MRPEARGLWLATVLALSSVLFFAGLGRDPLYSKGEGREAVQVWEQLHTGNWILPRRNGTELPSKPPLFHWLAGVSALAAGELTALTLRLPSAIAAAIGVLLTFWFGARLYGVAAGALAALALATSAEWLHAARQARVDMVFTACLTAAFVSFGVALASARPSRAALTGFYFSSALAVLAKGPAGFALPALVAVVSLALRGERGRWRSFHPFVGTAVALGVPAVWYALAAADGGMAFVDKQIIGENLRRFAGLRAGAGHRHSLLYYGPAFAAGFLPWSALVAGWIVGGRAAARRGAANGLAFPLVWFGVTLAFFSLAAGKRAVYLLPAYPAAAVLLGAAWQRACALAAPPAPVRWACASLAAIAVLAALLVLLVAYGHPLGIDALAWIAPRLHARDQANLSLIMPAVDAHRGALTIAAAIFMGAAAVLVRYRGDRGWPAPVALVVGATVGALTVQHVFQPALARQRTHRALGETLRATLGENDRVVFYGRFDYGLAFYAQRRIPVVATLPALDAAAPVYVLLSERQWKQLPEQRRGGRRVIARSDGTGASGKDRLVLTLVPPSYQGGD